ncbi:hypothetical protein HDU67_003582 [Dinochytrium kinnereticum]|nr:hypothetical protein HDU67_003582 [Dinochytrium kinnereticum]
MKKGNNSTSPEHTVDGLLQQAQKAVDICQPTLAIKFLERALAIEPNHVQALEALGIVEMEVSVAAAAVESDHEYSAVGEATEKARMYFQRAIEIDSDSVGSAAFLYMGQLLEGYDAVRHYEMGIQRLEMEVEGVDRSSAEYFAVVRKISSALCSMTEIYMTDCCEAPEAESLCVSYMEKAVTLDPSNPEVLQTLASVRLSQCRPEEARTALEKSVSIWLLDGPESPNWPAYDQRIACAKLLLELGLHDNATLVLQTCQNENDLDPEGWYLFGWCYYRMGGGDAGTADQEVAAGIGKSIEGNVVPEENRGELWTDAKECLEKLLELVAEDEMANADMIDHAKFILQAIETYLQANPVTFAIDSTENQEYADDDEMEM